MSSLGSSACEGSLNRFTVASSSMKVPFCKACTSDMIISSTSFMISSILWVLSSTSSIQNSLTCRGVSLFSARKVGENVHTLGYSCMYASRCSCEDTVRYFDVRKKEESSGTPSAHSPGIGAPVLSEKTSPAPSQSEDVIIGACTRRKPRSRKNCASKNSDSDRNRASRVCKGRRSLRCGMVRRNSGVWYFFWIGYLFRYHISCSIIRFTGDCRDSGHCETYF